MTFLKLPIMASIWDYYQFTKLHLLGEWDVKEQGEQQRAAVEEFMSYCSMEQED